nr:hypothetical protein [Halarchaeum acidiphilum]
MAVLNTAIGVLAGLLVFPLLFSFGLDVGSGGAGAVFVSVASAFASLGTVGRLLGVVFFAVVLLAALSSSISMLEIPVAYLVDEHGVSRAKATAGVACLVAIGAAACALSSSVFGLLANTLVNLLMTAGLCGFLLFVGWVLGSRALDEYRAGAGDVARAVDGPWLLFVGVLIPVFLLFTLFTSVASALGVPLGTHVLGVGLGGSAVALVAAIVVTALAVAGLRRPGSLV